MYFCLLFKICWMFLESQTLKEIICQFPIWLRLNKMQTKGGGDMDIFLNYELYEYSVYL